MILIPINIIGMLHSVYKSLSTPHVALAHLLTLILLGTG